MASGAIEAAFEWLLPTTCAACAAPFGPRSEAVRRQPIALLCDDCVALLEPLPSRGICPRCGAFPRWRRRGIPTDSCIDCAQLPRSFQAARSAFPYDSPVGAIIRNMKYQGASWTAPILIELIRPHLADWLCEATAGAVIAPVPMTPWRQLRRGFNQAEAIAIALARDWDRPLLAEGVLVRSQWRSPQARVRSREARMDNLAGSFRVTESHAVAGRAFLLVDDVMTTGATVATAAASLQQAGAGPIRIVTVARASLRHPDADYVEAPAL